MGMKFIFNDVGPVKLATIELGALTIVCGENNTGKTYLTNCIYEFYRQLSRKTTVRSLEHIPDVANVVKIDLERYRNLVVEAVKSVAERYTKQNNSLHGGRFLIDITPSELPIDFPVSPTIWKSQLHDSKFSVVKDGSELTISKREHVRETGICANEDLKAQWHAVVNSVINNYLFRQDYTGGYFGDAFYMTSERMGIAYFKDCLDIAMRATRINDEVGTSNDESVDSDSLKSTLFPESVYTQLDIISWLGQRAKASNVPSKKFMTDFGLDIESLIGGTYNLDGGKIHFCPTGCGEKDMEAQDVSSSVRALFSLDMYIRYLAEKGDLLVIDEPEMNLHPNRQRKFARLIAKLVNAGVKVFLTTHSDYILREFNLLLQLNGKRKGLETIREKAGYAKSEMLDAGCINAYVAKSVDDGFVFENAEVSQDRGIAIDAIDSVINEMNQLQELITWGV